jgi:dTDP-glucose 4,6-dehydratase
MNVLITGGAGFIGSAYVRHRLDKHPRFSVRVLDKLTYAGRAENLDGLDDRRCSLVVADIADRDAVRAALRGCDAVVNFAAETHVDRSIEAPGEFIQTDVYGTYVLLEEARDANVRHLQVSTDEVYGSIEQGSFDERSPLDPSSPYSASKAGGDLLVGAFRNTYEADALIVRASNNYGPRQYPEKLVPLCILNALAGDPLPVYGDGQQVRNWLWAPDFADAIDTVLEFGQPGDVYNVGGPDERANIDVGRRILELTGRDESLIEYVSDRPGHDRRYSLSSQKTRGLGWEPAVGFEDGIARTVEWYRANEWWWEPIRSGEYRDYYERRYGRTLQPGASSQGASATGDPGSAGIPPGAPG